MIEQPENEMLFDVAVLGKCVENFMGSEVGKYLLERAEHEIKDGFDELKRCDPENSKAVRRIQNKIQMAESIKLWLEEAIVAGAKATMVLEDREET